jgi:hypothetical protein
MFQWYVVVGFIISYLWVNRSKLNRESLRFPRKESLKLPKTEEIVSGAVLLALGGLILAIPYFGRGNFESRLTVSAQCVADVNTLDSVQSNSFLRATKEPYDDNRQNITVCGGSRNELIDEILFPKNSVKAILTATVRKKSPSKGMRVYLDAPVASRYCVFGGKQYALQLVEVNGVERCFIQLSPHASQSPGAIPIATSAQELEVDGTKRRCYATTTTTFVLELLNRSKVSKVISGTSSDQPKPSQIICR